MFNKKANNENMAPTSTIIGRDTKIVGGALTGNATLRIDGTFEGTINIEGHLILGESGSIVGNIKAQSATLAGTAKSGMVVCEGCLHIVAKGSLYGDIQVGSLVVDEDSVFIGNCKMNTGISNDATPVGKGSYGFSATEDKSYGKVEVPY